MLILSMSFARRNEQVNLLQVAEYDGNAVHAAGVAAQVAVGRTSGQNDRV